MNDTPAPRPKNTDHPDVVALPPLIYLGALFSAIILHAFAPLDLRAGNAYAVLGLVMFILGVVPLVESFKRFLNHDTPPPPNLTPRCVVISGFYKYSRNPMYVGMSAMYFGLALLLNNAWALMLLPVILIVMHYGVVLREETYMEKKFGDEYLNYKKSVRRYL